MNLVFPISLSVGTKCQAKCHYCNIPLLPQKITKCSDLIHSTEKKINEISKIFNFFRVRLTGGEIGMVRDFNLFIDWLNNENRVVDVELYTNGLIFNFDSIDLSKKCCVIDHTIHEVIDSNFIRYASDLTINNISEINSLINERISQCFSYKMVLIDTGKANIETMKELKKLGVVIKPLINLFDRILCDEKTRKINYYCFYSKYFYTYDVAHKMYFNCCQVKDPKYGVNSTSLYEFLSSKKQKPYEECLFCLSGKNAIGDRNTKAINFLKRHGFEKKN